MAELPVIDVRLPYRDVERLQKCAVMAFNAPGLSAEECAAYDRLGFLLREYMVCALEDAGEDGDT